MMRIASSWSVSPHAPNIIAPRQSGDTCTPVRPSSLRSTAPPYNSRQERRRCAGARHAHPVARAPCARYLPPTAVNENFSLIVMCLFLLGSLAFLAQQLTSYH